MLKKRFFTLFFALAASVGMMFAKTETQDISMDAANWNWGKNCNVTAVGNLLQGYITSEYGYMAIGWNPTIDLSSWDKLVVEVANTNGCGGEHYLIKAFLRDLVNKDSEQGQMEAAIGPFEDEGRPYTLEINLKEEGKNVNLTACGVIGIQVQPNGAEFKISRVYLEREITGHTLRLTVNDPTMGSVKVTNLEEAGITDNGDGTYTVPDEAEVIIRAIQTPVCKFSGWKVGNRWCDFTECGTALNTINNPMTFTMTADTAFMAMFEALPPDPNIVVWDSTFVKAISCYRGNSGTLFNVRNVKDGVTAFFTGNEKVNGLLSGELMFDGPSALLTFSHEAGKIAKAEVYGTLHNTSATEYNGWVWDADNNKLVWEGTPDDTISIQGQGSGKLYVKKLTYIIFTLVPATPEDVMALINAIGTVEYTAECKAKIDAARKTYERLVGDVAKAAVTNYSTLTKAETDFATLQSAAVQNAIDKIAAIPTPVVYTEACGNAIDAARAAYNALLEADMSQIPEASVTKLTEAEKTYADLKKVVVVEAKIDAIPTPVEATLATRDSIQNARAAYDALTAAQKALVNNYDKLLDAEAALARLMPPPSLPEGALSGKFRINAAGDQIMFAKGNLQATTEDLGATWTWGFATNQWDTIGCAGANTKITGNGTVSENGTVDLFGWSTEANYYGIHKSTSSDDYSGNVLKDWGENITGAEWRTLTQEEWKYVVQGRPNDKNLRGQATVNGMNGYILLPEDWELPSGLSFTPMPNNWTANVYEGDDWTAMENAGAVFLPLAPRRYGIKVEMQTTGSYWTATKFGSSSSGGSSWMFQILEDFAKTDMTSRYYGYSVRLTTPAVNTNPFDSAQAVKELIEAIPAEITMDDACVNALMAASEGYAALSNWAKGTIDAATVQKLKDAEAAYNTLLVQGVIDMINALPNPMTEATTKLSVYTQAAEVRAAYDALTPAQQDVIPAEILKKLTDVEAVFNNIAGGGSGETVIKWDKNTGIETVPKGATSPAYEGMTVTTKKGSKFTGQNSPDQLTFVFLGGKGGFAFANVDGYHITKVDIESTEAMENALSDPASFGTGWVLSNENKTAIWTGDADTVKLWDDVAATAFWNVDYIQFTIASASNPIMDAFAAVDLINLIPDPVTLEDACVNAIKDARAAVDSLYENKSLIDDPDMLKLTNAEAALKNLNQAEANKVIEKINNIPQPVELKLATRDSIEGARAAYDALTADQQDLVTNYQTLLDAEAALAELNKGGSTPVDIVWDKNTGIEGVSPATTSPAYEGMTVTVGKGSSFSMYQSRLYFNFYSQPNGGFIFANENGTNITKVVIESTTALTSTMTEVDRMGSGWVISNENKTATWTGNADSVSIWEGQSFTNYWVVDRITFTVNGTATPLDSAQAVKDLIEAIPQPVYHNEACNNAITAARNAYDALSEATKGALDDATVQILIDAEAAYAERTPKTLTLGVNDESRGSVKIAPSVWKSVWDKEYLRTVIAHASNYTSGPSTYDYVNNIKDGIMMDAQAYYSEANFRYVPESGYSALYLKAVSGNTRSTLLFDIIGGAAIDNFQLIEIYSPEANHNFNSVEYAYWTYNTSKGCYQIDQFPQQGHVEVMEASGNEVDMRVDSIIFYAPSDLPKGVTATETPGVYTVDWGTELNVVALPKEGYHLESWSNGVEVTGDTLALTITSDSTLIATFEGNEYALSFNTEGLDDTEAAKWAVTPNPAKTAEAVTVTYSGEKKVSGVAVSAEAGGLQFVPFTSQMVENWSSDYETPLTEADLPGFKGVTLAEAKTCDAPVPYTLIYSFDTNNPNIVKVVSYDGEDYYPFSYDISHFGMYTNVVEIGDAWYYTGTGGAAVEVLPVDGKTNEWTFTMPAGEAVMTPIYAEASIKNAQGETLYATLKDAFAAVQNGDTLKLEKDATISESLKNSAVEQSMRFVLDLNGQVIDGSDLGYYFAIALVNNGDEMLIIDSSADQMGGIKGMIGFDLQREGSIIFDAGRYTESLLGAKYAMEDNGWVLAENKEFKALEGGAELNDGFRIKVDWATFTITLPEGVNMVEPMPEGIVDKGNGVYEALVGTEFQISADSIPEHYHFGHWADLNNEDAQYAANPRTIVAGANLTIEPIYDIDTYTLTLGQVDPTMGALSIDGAGAGQGEGGTMDIEWNSEFWNSIKAYMNGHDYVHANNSKDGITITFEGGDFENGLKSGEIKLEQGNTLTLTSTVGEFTKIFLKGYADNAPEGWDYVGGLTWEVTPSSSAVPSATVVLPGRAQLALFEKAVFTIIPAAASGIVDNGDGTYTVDWGTELTFVAKAADGYHVQSWSNGAEVNDLVEATQTITMTEALDITALFAENPIITLASNDPTMGVVTLAGAGNQLTVEGSNSDVNMNVPIRTNSANDTRTMSQSIYPAALLSSIAGESISGMTFYISEPSTKDITATYVVKLMETEQAAFSNAVAVNTESATTVYTGTIDATGNTLDIVFDQPYAYNGGNLLVEFSISSASQQNGLSKFSVFASQGGSYMQYYHTGFEEIRYYTNDFLAKTTFNCGGQGIPGVIDLGNGQYNVLPGTELTFEAVPAKDYHLVSWSNGAEVTEDNKQTLTITDEFSLSAFFKHDTYILTVEGAEVETAKFADGTNTAVVLNPGTLVGVVEGDSVTLTTTATFSSAEVGDDLTITLHYEIEVVEDGIYDNEYALAITDSIYPIKGAIIEPMIKDNDAAAEDAESSVKEGLEIYAYGYCHGSEYSIRYHLKSGQPDQYKLTFADSRFTNVDWTDLTTAGKEGMIDVEIPVDLPTGDYTMTVTFRDSRYTWLESDPITVALHVNLPETYVRPLFDNVIAIVDTCECLTDIQWYWRADSGDEWQAIEGATGYYYKQEGGLSGEYFAKVKMNGVETYTCPQEDVETLYGEDVQAKVSAYPNPVRNRMNVSIENSDKFEHNVRIVNLLGNEVVNSTFEGTSTTIDMGSYPQGNYMVSVDGIVVKVMKQ